VRQTICYFKQSDDLTLCATVWYWGASATVLGAEINVSIAYQM